MRFGSFLRSIEPEGAPGESTFAERRDAARASLVDYGARLAVAGEPALVDPFPPMGPPIEPYYTDADLRQMASMYAAVATHAPAEPCEPSDGPMEAVYRAWFRHFQASIRDADPTPTGPTYVAFTSMLGELRLVQHGAHGATADLGASSAEVKRELAAHRRSMLDDARRAAMECQVRQDDEWTCRRCNERFASDDRRRHADECPAVGVASVREVEQILDHHEQAAWTQVAMTKAQMAAYRAAPRGLPGQLVLAEQAVAREQEIADLLHRNLDARLAETPVDRRDAAARHLAYLHRVQDERVYCAQQDAREIEVDVDVERQVERSDGALECADCHACFPLAERRVHSCRPDRYEAPTRVHRFVPRTGKCIEYAVFPTHAATRDRYTADVCRDLYESFVREPIAPTDRRAGVYARAFGRLSAIGLFDPVDPMDDAAIAAELDRLVAASRERMKPQPPRLPAFRSREAVLPSIPIICRPDDPPSPESSICRVTRDW
jgi:hypothetical protein